MGLEVSVPIDAGSQLNAGVPSTCCNKLLGHTVTVTVTVNGLVKLLAFNVHIFPSKYLDSF